MTRFFLTAWIVWAGAFIVLETAAIMMGYRYTLTAHLRPVTLSWPIIWFVMLGVWLWLGVHFLVPVVEQWIGSTVMRDPWR